MNYMLDTNACIQYLNGTSTHLRRKLESSQPEEIFLCAIVRAELFYGAIKSANASKNVQKLRHFLNRFISLPFDDQSAEIYGCSTSRQTLESLAGPLSEEGVTDNGL